MSKSGHRGPIDPSQTADGDPAIRVRGARVHNLQNIDLDIPRDRLVVITGVSGSGKSSLAFDTLYAEGQRQYIESLSVYARQFFHQLQRPDIDLLDGLQPTICIDQHAGSHNPRSTVATVTEIYDYLRLLMARIGEPLCHRCGEPIQTQTSEQIQQRLLRLPQRTKAMIMAPMVRGRKGRHHDIFAAIRKAGFVRARVDGQVLQLDDLPELAPGRLHDIEAVVDRVVIHQGVAARLAESIDLAIRHGEGAVVVSYLDAAGGNDSGGGGRWRDELFSTLYACPKCGISVEELEPRTFSFNSPYGACRVCEGLGSRIEFDPELVLPDRRRSLAEGVVVPWKGATPAETQFRQSQLKPFMDRYKFGWDTPLAELRPKAARQLLEGDGRTLLGVLTLLEKEFATATHPARRERLEAVRGPVVCQACGGSRLRPEAASVRVGGKAIHQITAMCVAEVRPFFQGLHFDGKDRPVAEPIVSDIAKRLAFLEKVGVDYLTLDRPAATLSGGEFQRVRLATSIGSGLVGVCYVLDEPSIGLHQRDNQRLIESLRDLQAEGNTVLVVEHDEAMMRQADQLIDMGPSAGAGGGRIVAQGTPDEVGKDAGSLTGRYLSGQWKIVVPVQRRRVAKTRSIVIEGVRTNNLKDTSVSFPLGVLVGVTGVSGSGKSSLVSQTLAPAVLRRLGGVGRKPGPHQSLRGVSQIDKVIQIDQSPIGRTPRSNPATYTGVFDEVRKVFAATRQARQRGYGAGRFSFNVKAGRCQECQGQGVRKIEMNFLPDLYVTCSECQGARFNRHTLAVRYRGKSIADMLEMGVADAVEFFENFSLIRRRLETLRDVGLGYLPLGQPSTTLSGGEAQRIKLATQLARVEAGDTLYILDEPTTGLHFDDIKMLLSVLGRLVDRGNTVIVIEHNLDVIKSVDWIIDLGPEGGQAGGYVVATGTPEQIAAMKNNHTGQFLRPLLNGKVDRAG